MDIIAIVISIVSVVVAIISVVVAIISLERSSKSQQLQDKVNQLDVRIKSYELNQKEEENRPKTFIETLIINISKGKYCIRVYNSGNTIAYNIIIHIDENARIIITDQEKMPYEVLEPGDSFDINFIVAMGSARKFNVTVNWEDEDGNKQEKTQLRNI